MPLNYDPNDTSEFAHPTIGVPTAVTIGQGKEATSNAGNQMLVLGVQVDHGEEGAGFRTKEYLVDGVNWKIRQVMRSVGIDPDKKHPPIDDLFFRDRKGTVIFKAEDFTGTDGNIHTSYKIDKWVEAESTPKGVKPTQKSNDNSAEDPVYTEDQIPFS